jgi:CubicO group peptidase (beta-lactamase class C family)
MKRLGATAALLLLSSASVSPGADLVSRLDVIARDAVVRKVVPGLALGVMRGGHVLIAKGYGTGDLENDLPVRAGSVFSIASITKTFTAVAILKLAENGSLALDDDISRYVPDYPERDKGVTIRRLLNHTAGIHNITSVAAYRAQMARVISPAELTAFFRDLPLDFEPGSRYAYSNSGYILLGLVIEKASGPTVPGLSPEGIVPAAASRPYLVLRWANSDRAAGPRLCSSLRRFRKRGARGYESGICSRRRLLDRRRSSAMAGGAASRPGSQG